MAEQKLIKRVVEELAAADPLATKDPDELVKAVLARISEAERTELLVQYVRRAVLPFTRTPDGTGARPAAALAPNPRTGEALRTQHARRPFWIPSLGGMNDAKAYVTFNEMTREHWGEYIRSRRQIASISTSLAEWGGHNLRALDENRVKTSGELPENIRESLLRRMPQAAGKELAPNG